MTTKQLTQRKEQCWDIDEHTAGCLRDFIGEGDETAPITFSFGFAQDDEGKVSYGLRAFLTAYPEEGCLPLVECPAPVAAIPCAPDTIGVELTPQDLDRLEQAVEKMQTEAPDLSIDDCVNLIFATGLAMAESPGGLDVIKTYATIIKAAKEAA